MCTLEGTFGDTLGWDEEGALGGLVNLTTRKPLDIDDNIRSLSIQGRHSGFADKQDYKASLTLSQKFADRLLEEGIYVIGFFYPVVPKEQARIRVQLSAAHDKEHLDKAIAAFEKVGRELGVIPVSA